MDAKFDDLMVKFIEDQYFLQSKCLEPASITEREKLITDSLWKWTSYNLRCPDFDQGLNWVNTDHPLSLSRDFSDKIVVLDFFTYCCINCLHILPTLDHLESKYSSDSNISFIGVHSPKFSNEKNSQQLSKAVERYSIKHSVVNDSESTLWQRLNITCWPTVIIIGPGNRLLFQLTGERTINNLLKLFIEKTFGHFFGKFKCENFETSRDEIDRQNQGTLYFPGKVAFDICGNRIAISDSGHNRVLVASVDGRVTHSIGSRVGDSLGEFGETRLNNPQGVVWLDDETFALADTGNHRILRVDLSNKNVEKIDTKAVTIQSPWDLTFVNGVLYIAAAGSHQIFSICLQSSIKVNKSQYSVGETFVLAGNGREENRNNNYLHEAGFAQPSGICFSPQFYSLFIADSESSSIRQVDLNSFKVKNVVGGGIDPLDLFQFGDLDGKSTNVRLQHPTGIGFEHQNNTLLVADTYNHKIKKICVEKRSCSTLTLDTNLNEPSDIEVHPKERYSIIVDSNNHRLVRLDLVSYQTSEFRLKFDENESLSRLVTERLPQSLICSHRLVPFKPVKIEFKLNFSEKLVASLVNSAQNSLKFSVKGADWNIEPKTIKFSNPNETMEVYLKPTNGSKSDENFELHANFCMMACQPSLGLCSTRRVSLIFPFSITTTDNGSDYLVIEDFIPFSP